MSETKRLRLFVALELPVEWRDALAREALALETAAPGFGRWVDPALMHLTLVFLGWQDAGLVATIEGAVAAAAASAGPFTLQLGAPGSFGGRRWLRVIWVGVGDHPAGALSRLHAAVIDQLAAAKIDFDTDANPFRAHITLGRARRDVTTAQSETMHAAIERRTAEAVKRPLAPDELLCDEVTLMRSDLRPTGPTYTPLYRFKMGPRDDGRITGQNLTESV